MPRQQDLDDPADDTSSHQTLDAATEDGISADSDVTAAGSDDDEDVSLDELMMSDSSEDDGEEEEEEATDIHPGLSEAVLAESLGARVIETEQRAPADPDASLADAEAVVDEEPSSGPSAISDVSPAEEPLSARGLVGAASAPSETDPEEVVIASEEGPAEELIAAEPPASDVTAAGAAIAAPESVPGNEEPTRPDASPLDSPEVLDVSPESESEVLSGSAIEAVALEAEASLEAEEPIVAADIELDDGTESAERPVSAPAADSSGERKTIPATVTAKRRDAPLPSFDIPDLDAVSATRTTAPQPAVRAAAQPVSLPPLSEVGEDDDDAVTHMGLPSVPESANDYPGAAKGFQVADPAIAALQSIDADIARGDSRRATTRVIPRVDPKSLPAKPRVNVPAGPPLAARLSAAARDTWEWARRSLRIEAAEALLAGEPGNARPRLNWMVENVLPPLSLVLFGSGLGAGVIMLVGKDRGEDVGPARAVHALQDPAAPHAAPVTLADRARSGDGEALYKITNMAQGERTSALTLALEAGYQAQKQREFREFSKTLSSAPRPLPAASLARMVDFATSPETMLSAFQELTQWAGPSGPDVLYAVWEKAAGGSRAASLAQQLLYSADQRAKATPALVVALDLRSAASCDDYLRVLPAVMKNGDQRSSATLRALRHNDGCGGDGKQDCYACLRDNSLLEDALKAVEKR